MIRKIFSLVIVLLSTPLNNMNNITRKIYLSKKSKKAICILVLVLSGCWVLTGCSIKRVSILNIDTSQTQINPIDVKSYSNFKSIGVPYKIQGMVQITNLPLVENTPKGREKSLIELAGTYGANAIACVNSTKDRWGYGLVGFSNAILVKTDNSIDTSAQNVTPRFITFVPTVNFNNIKFSTDYRNNLDTTIRLYLRYYMGFWRGYYLYNYDPPRTSRDDILQGSFEFASLTDPIGITPDYVLFCDVEENKEYIDSKWNSSVPGIVTLRLFDLKKNSVAWKASARIDFPKERVPGKCRETMDTIEHKSKNGGYEKFEIKSIQCEYYDVDYSHYKNVDYNFWHTILSNMLSNLPAIDGFKAVEEKGSMYPLP